MVPRHLPRGIQVGQFEPHLLLAKINISSAIEWVAFEVLGILRD
jgi:hypothetical protein